MRLNDVQYVIFTLYNYVNLSHCGHKKLPDFQTDTVPLQHDYKPAGVTPVH